MQLLGGERPVAALDGHLPRHRPTTLHRPHCRALGMRGCVAEVLIVLIVGVGETRHFHRRDQISYVTSTPDWKPMADLSRCVCASETCRGVRDTATQVDRHAARGEGPIVALHLIIRPWYHSSPVQTTPHRLILCPPVVGIVCPRSRRRVCGWPTTCTSSRGPHSRPRTYGDAR